MEVPGLSPRVRGNRFQHPEPLYAERSIPACAGEPGRRGRANLIFGVYPRVCGGTQHRQQEPGEQDGLSPRVRGNHAACGFCPHTGGSIPACAGEPTNPQPQQPQRRVYPRVCGGTCPGRPGRRTLPGLSPRVRGNPRIAVQHSAKCRSIPACAGEPRAGDSHRSHCGVYPRVCGGTYSLPSAFISLRGLSPRVRGNPRA